MYLLRPSLLFVGMGIPLAALPLPTNGAVELPIPVLMTLGSHHTAKPTATLTVSKQLVWPISGAYRIASGYGMRRDPLTGRKALHQGLDIPAAVGTGILAIGAGRVHFSGWKAGYGRVVEIDHGKGWLSRYAHAQALLVVTGATVWAGQTIAKVGKSGRATGPHLHFEVWQHGRPVNPLPFWRSEGVQTFR